jgi:tetratricopeptide (TPR) repeat protein
MLSKRASAGEKIELEIARENWIGARKLIEAEQRREPGNHWLLTRLSLTYYEQRQYAKALELTTQALKLAPSCPLVLWDHAGTLEMLGRTNEALTIFQRLIERGVDHVANDPCGEGLAWARGLVADSLYRMAHCYRTLEVPQQAIEAFTRHLAMRGPGCRSIYAIGIVREELSQSEKSVQVTGASSDR